MSDTSNAEYTGPLSNGAGDSAGAAHSGTAGQGAVTGPDAANAAQAGVHADGGPVEITADKLTTASRMSFESAMNTNMPDVLLGLQTRWGAAFDERLAGVHAIATNKLETLGADKFGQLIDDLSEKGWLADPRFWDGLSRMSPGKAASRPAAAPRKEGVAMSDDPQAQLRELRAAMSAAHRRHDDAEARRIQDDIYALDKQIYGEGKPIVGRMGRSA